MPISPLEVTKANVVFVGLGLLQSPDELTAFKGAVDTDVISSGGIIISSIAAATTETGRMLSIQRDRIELELTPARSTISQEYPPLDNKLERLATVAGLAITHTDLGDATPGAFGFNIEAVYDQESGLTAYEYLAERLFATDLTNEGDDWKLTGGAAKKILESGPTEHWQVNLQPRFNDLATSKIFIGLNLHLSEPRVPPRDEIETLLIKLRDRIHEFTERLDGKGVAN